MGDSGRSAPSRHRGQVRSAREAVAPHRGRRRRTPRRHERARERGPRRSGRLLHAVAARHDRRRRGADARRSAHPRRRLGERRGRRAHRSARARVHDPDRQAHPGPDPGGDGRSDPTRRSSRRAGAGAARAGRPRPRRGADRGAGEDPTRVPRTHDGDAAHGVPLGAGARADRDAVRRGRGRVPRTAADVRHGAARGRAGRSDPRARGVLRAARGGNGLPLLAGGPGGTRAREAAAREADGSGCPCSG